MKHILLVACLLLSICCFAQNGNETVTVKRHGYTIQYPGAWMLDTTTNFGSGVDLVLLAPKDNEADNFSTNFNLIIQDMSAQPMSLDSFAALSKNQYAQFVKNSTIISNDKISSPSKEYYKLIVEIANEKRTVKIEQYYFIRNKNAYVLTFTTEKSKFEASQKEGEAILNSFVLNK